MITIMLFINNISYSQDNIKSSENFNNNIKKSTRLSAILPGLGQVNNKQYWKIPIIYGGYSVIGHYIKFNNNMYQEFRTALIHETDDNTSTINPFPNFPVFPINVTLVLFSNKISACSVLSKETLLFFVLL